jgi:membrane-associated phospholipid phosphatase
MVRRLAVALAAAAGFALVTWNVVAEVGLARFDDDIMRWVLDHRTAWATSVLKVLTWFGSTLILWPIVGLTGVLLIARGRRWRPAILLVVALGGSILLTDLVKAATDLARPPFSTHLVEVTGSAYPSGHAMDSLAVFAALAMVVGAGRSPGARAWLWVGAASMALIVGWSRIYLGVHWMTDVVGGWLLAVAWVAATSAFVLRPPAAPVRTEPYPPGPDR